MTFGIRMESATLEVFAVVVLSPSGFFKKLCKLEVGDRLMMKRNVILRHKCWQMSLCVHNANISLLEMLEWNVNWIIRVPIVTTIRGGLAVNIS